MLGSTPKIHGDDRIYVADGTRTNTLPLSADWVELELCINKTPNFFPSREKEEYRVLDRTQALSIQGERPSIDGTLDVYLNASFANGYRKMVESQNDASKGGCFWFKIVKASEARTIYCRCTIDDKIPNDTNESGGLDIYSLNMTNIDEAIEAYTISYNANGGQGEMPASSDYLPNEVVNVDFTSAPTLADGTFVGWATEPTAISATYTSSGEKTFRATQSVTLYAIYTKN